MGAMEVLERLAALDPWDLCNEAKVEKCRATRDLRSCGRSVKHLLTSCGHACLCEECSKRCDICPVCRTPITSSRPILRPRLYDECVQAGFLPLVRESDFREKEIEGPYWTLDAWRLCSFFDVAVDHNLASVVCHYVSDVCMDEAAVSSDAVISMLLDGAVVKEWCKRTLTATTRALKEIYDSKSALRKTDALDKHVRRLEGVCSVLEALEAPLDTASASLLELHGLLDGSRLALQHLEVMTWCITNSFLENIQSCHANVGDWKFAFQERKQAALYRAWPDYVRGSGRFGCKPRSTLFIEDALRNINFGESSNEYVTDLLRRRGSSYMAYSDREGITYPPESVTAAVDLLFLRGTPELFLAKKATFLYYLYDRHWRPEPEQGASWRRLIDDYANCFSIPRQSLLESFAFYLLDNNDEIALQRACQLLPEIVSPNLHPKISRVLLERNRADVALSVLKSSGRFTGGESLPVPLVEAVTAVRVWTKCGLLMEAYKYQQTHCKVLKAEAVKYKAAKEDGVASSRDGAQEMDVLVGELCLLCIQLNRVDKMLELPWQQAEEKVLMKCLYEQAIQDPCSTAGTLSVVFYLQRCRFMEASAVHHRLQQVEQQCLGNYPDGDSAIKLRNMCEYRTKLLDKCLEQLPEVERDQLLEDESASVLGEPSSLEAMQQDDGVPQEFEFQARPCLEATLSPAIPPSNLLVSRKQAYIVNEDTNGPSSSSWGAGLQSSLLLKSTKLSNSNSELLNGMVATSNGGAAAAAAADLFPRPTPLLSSPLLGKRLRYESDLHVFRHFAKGGDATATAAAAASAAAAAAAAASAAAAAAAAGGTPAPATATTASTATQPMVVTW